MKVSMNKLMLATAVAALSTTASAGMSKDRHGNVGYDTMAECNQAIANGTAKFYKSHTLHAPKRRAGEASVRQVRLSQVSAKYANGSCDRGTGRRGGRDGVARVLQGKYVPFSPNMPVNAYLDRSGKLVRVSMAKCDNWFSGSFPTPHVKPYKAVKQPKKVTPVAVAPTAKPIYEAPKPVKAVEAAPKASGASIWPALAVTAAIGVAAAVIDCD